MNNSNISIDKHYLSTTNTHTQDMSTALLNLLFAQVIYKQLVDAESDAQQEIKEPSNDSRKKTSPLPASPEFFLKLSRDLKEHPLNSEFNLSPGACQSLYNALFPQNPTRPTGVIMQALLAKLYDSYKKDIVAQIQHDEAQFSLKLKEIEQIEQGKLDIEILEEHEKEKAQNVFRQKAHIQRQNELLQKHESAKRVQPKEHLSETEPIKKQENIVLSGDIQHNKTPLSIDETPTTLGSKLVESSPVLGSESTMITSKVKVDLKDQKYRSTLNDSDTEQKSTLESTALIPTSDKTNNDRPTDVETSNSDNLEYANSTDPRKEAVDDQLDMSEESSEKENDAITDKRVTRSAAKAMQQALVEDDTTTQNDFNVKDDAESEIEDTTVKSQDETNIDSKIKNERRESKRIKMLKEEKDDDLPLKEEPDTEDVIKQEVDENGEGGEGDDENEDGEDGEDAEDGEEDDVDAEENHDGSTPAPSSRTRSSIHRRDDVPKSASKKRKRGSSPPPKISTSVSTNRRFFTLVNPLISNISSNKSASFFANPVNPNDAPNYYDLIYEPTDLRTIKTKVKDGRIQNSAELERELQQMFANAVMYNGWDSDVSIWTREMQHDTETLLALFRGAERTAAANHNSNNVSQSNSADVSDAGDTEEEANLLEIKKRKK